MMNAFHLGASVALGLGLNPVVNHRQQTTLATGIVGTMFGPLGASRFAFGAFPQAMQTRCFCGLPQQGAIPEGTVPAAQWTAQLTGTGTADIDLGDGYTLQLDERQSEIFIRNANTGETTRIWGDPHVDVDGKRVFDFWGTTTFTLASGTKITINTEQWGGNSNAYVASQVVITRGSNAIVVDGISQNTLGDLELTMSDAGEAIDAQHRDGFVLHENAAGAGWLSEFTGDLATQADLDATRIGAAYGPGSTALSLGESARMISTFLLLGLFTGALDAGRPGERT